MHPPDSQTPPTIDQLGRFHRFGALGPVYEVKGFEKPAPCGDWLMRVQVIETGEEVDYLASRIQDDPKVDG